MGPREGVDTNTPTAYHSFTEIVTLIALLTPAALDFNWQYDSLFAFGRYFPTDCVTHNSGQRNSSQVRALVQ